MIGIVPCPPRRGKDDACARLRIPSGYRSLNRLRVEIVVTRKEERASDVERV
jgi:hypothetical protein